MNETSCCNYPNINDCLPYISYPFYNESLVGYILRLEFLNGFSPFSLFNACIADNKKMFYRIQDLESLEEILDSKIISCHTTISPETIEKMKISNIRRRLFRYNCPRTKKNLRYGETKICPECINDLKVLQIFLFDDVKVCLTHGLKLIPCKDLFALFDKMNSKNQKGKEKFYYRYKSAAAYNINYELEHVTQSIFKTYLSEDISLVRKDEKLVKGLMKRIEYIANVKKAASQAFLDTRYSGLYKEIISSKYGYNLNNVLNISVLIRQLYEITLLPFQFLNINSEDINAPLIIYIGSFSSLRTYTSRPIQDETFYSYNIKGQNKKSILQTDFAPNAVEKDKVIYFDVKVYSGRIIFQLKCCTYKK